MPTKKKPKKKPDVDIKIRNLDKTIKAADKYSTKKSCCNCCGFWVFGSALAMILSYERSSSILWAILHGILSWLYILYRAFQIWF